MPGKGGGWLTSVCHKGDRGIVLPIPGSWLHIYIEMSNPIENSIEALKVCSAGSFTPHDSAELLPYGS